MLGLFAFQFWMERESNPSNAPTQAHQCAGFGPPIG